LGLLADTRLKAGLFADAMQAVNEAIRGSDERYYSAELHRLNGELLARLPHGDVSAAGASFQIALKIAKEQGAAQLARKASESFQRWCG